MDRQIIHKLPFKDLSIPLDRGAVRVYSGIRVGVAVEQDSKVATKNIHIDLFTRLHDDPCGDGIYVEIYDSCRCGDF